MLKIAEYNTKTGKKIDLKELEKYGFTTIGAKEYWNKKITINCNTKKIRVTTWGSPYEIDVLYDLINDGYVEKVEE